MNMLKHYSTNRFVGCSIVKLALFALAMAGAWCAQAENLLLKDGVVLDLQGNTFNSDGSITIGDKGLVVRCSDTSKPLVAGTTTAGITIIAEVEDIPVPETEGELLTLLNVNNTWSTFNVNASGTYEVTWNRNTESWAHKTSTTSVTPGTHRIALAYRNSQGAVIIVDGKELVSSGGYSGGSSLMSVVIGQYADAQDVATGMKVTKIAVVDCRMTAAQVAAYDMSAPERYAQYAQDFQDRIVTLTGAGSMSGYYFKVKPNFSPKFGCEIATDTEYNGGTSYTEFPGYSGASTAFWHAFCKDVTGYVSPGLVLRIPTNTSSTAYSMYGRFPIALGGLIVEKGASKNGKLANIYDCFGESKYDERHTYLGDYVSGKESFFEFADDFTLCRRLACHLYGPININVDEGKTFAVTSVVATTVVELEVGATLKMHGLGTLKTPSVAATANNAKLDYSDLDLSRETPFIDGDLIINEYTKFAFPAGLAANTPYTLCSGTISGVGQTVVTTIAIGETEKVVTLIFDGNKVSYSESTVSAIVDGTAYESAQEAFDAAGAESTINFIVASDLTLEADKTIKTIICGADVAISGSGTLTLTNAANIIVSADKTLTIDAPVLIDGEVSKTDVGTVAFNGAFGKAEASESGKFTVIEGGAEFDGAISGVTVCGCGTNELEVNWPVITLKSNCSATLSANCFITPVLSNKQKRYGKVVQNGAAITGADKFAYDMMDTAGAAKYILNSGSITLSLSMALQKFSSCVGDLTFEQNGGTVSASGVTLCRTWLTPSQSVSAESCRYVLNGGTLDARISSADNLGRDDTHFADKLRVELNGGTYNVKNGTLFNTNGYFNVVFGGPVTLKNNSGTTTRAFGMVTGDAGKITFAGAGTFDFSAVTELSAGDIDVTGGTAILSDCMLDGDSSLAIAKDAKAGLAFEGTKDIKLLTLGGKEAVKNRVYGTSAKYFATTAEGGKIRPTTGRAPRGLIGIIR